MGILGTACVSVLPGQTYELAAHAKTLGARPGIVHAVWYGGLECDDDVVQTDEIGHSPPDEVWRAISAMHEAPENAQSLAIEISAERDPTTGLGSTSRLDAVMVSKPAGAVTTSSDAGGGGGGGCGLVGLELFLVLGLVRLGRRYRS